MVEAGNFDLETSSKNPQNKLPKTMFFQVDNIAKLSTQLRLGKLGNILTMNTSSFNTSYLEGLGMPSTCTVLAQTPTSLVPFWSSHFSKSSDIQKLGILSAHHKKNISSSFLDSLVSKLASYKA